MQHAKPSPFIIDTIGLNFNSYRSPNPIFFALLYPHYRFNVLLCAAQRVNIGPGKRGEPQEEPKEIWGYQDVFPEGQNLWYSKKRPSTHHPSPLARETKNTLNQCKKQLAICKRWLVMAAMRDNFKGDKSRRAFPRVWPVVMQKTMPAIPFPGCRHTTHLILNQASRHAG